MKKKRNTHLPLKEIFKVSLIIIIILLILFKLGQNNLFYNFLSRTFTRSIDYGSILPRKIGLGISYLSSLPKLKEKNKLLKKELNKLKVEHQHLEYLEKENKKLRSFLRLKKSPAYKFKIITAEVVNRPLNQWNQIFIINKGETDGIYKDCPVVCGEGIVGKISEATKHYAQVQLLTDPKSKISAQIFHSKTHGIVQGKLGMPLEMKYIDRDDDVKIGDKIVSSSLSYTYPKGLSIGTISQVEKSEYALFQKVIIKPFVDFSKIRFVFIKIK